MASTSGFSIFSLNYKHIWAICIDNNYDNVNINSSKLLKIHLVEDTLHANRILLYFHLYFSYIETAPII